MSWRPQPIPPTRGHGRARLSPLALWSAALWPLPHNANKIYGASVLRTAALDPIGHWSLRYTQLPVHTLCERGYHIAPVLNAPKLQKSSLSGRLGSCHPAHTVPKLRPGRHHVHTMLYHLNQLSEHERAGGWVPRRARCLATLSADTAAAATIVAAAADCCYRFLSG